ncbi:MAG: dihydrolipoyl dehydrogenase [Myxococcales bacterium]|nr:dihydrolipoyl dehydrogenase [Myxococcales bacterium]
MTDKSYDAIVIGGGPGGYVAAIRLGQLGQKTLVVEKETMGGVCLNWGCIPSKALIAAAGLVEKMQHANQMGITVKDVTVDVGKMQTWKNGIVKKLTGGVASLVKSAGGTVVHGTARLTGAHTVQVTSSDGTQENYVARKGIVVATGATPIQIPGFDVDGKVVVTAKEAVSLPKVPKTLVLIGGGIIGMELGMVYQKLGAKVVVVEMLPRILSGVDKDLVQVVERKFKKAGGEIMVKAKAKSCSVASGQAQVVVEQGGKDHKIDADCVLVAVGFRPNTGGLGLEEFGVALDPRGHVVVDEQLQTSVPGVYAIGDVTGMPYLAHRASKQGEVVAEVISGKKAACDYRAMPSAIFTDPEIATVGIGEEEAKEKDLSVKVGKFPFSVSGRAMAVGEPTGFVKTIVDAESDQVLGVSIVGPEASDLISEGALAIEMCAMAEDVALTVHPHPTLSEAMMESFKHALKEAVHIINK